MEKDFPTNCHKLFNEFKQTELYKNLEQNFDSAELAAGILWMAFSQGYAKGKTE